MNLFEELFKSAANGNLGEVKCLVESGADIHSEDDLALRFAASRGRLDVVKYLCEVYVERYGVAWCLTSSLEELRVFARELV